MDSICWCVLLSVSGPCAQQAPGAALPQTPAVRDDSPSDVAAIGFLMGFVDSRMLSLPGQGVAALRASATVFLDSAGSDHQERRFSLSQDFRTGTTLLRPESSATPLAPEWQQMAERAAMMLFFVAAPASSLSSDYVIRLNREDSKIRLDCRPRVTGDRNHSTFWFDPEGTLLSKRLEFSLESGPIQTSSFTYEVEPVGSQVLLTREIQTLGDQTATTRFQYAPVDGVTVLREIEVDGVLSADREGRWRRLPATVRVQYDVQLERAGAR